MSMASVAEAKVCCKILASQDSSHDHAPALVQILGHSSGSCSLRLRALLSLLVLDDCVPATHSQHKFQRQGLCDSPLSENSLPYGVRSDCPRMYPTAYGAKR